MISHCLLVAGPGGKVFYGENVLLITQLKSKKKALLVDTRLASFFYKSTVLGAGFYPNNKSGKQAVVIINPDVRLGLSL